MERPRSGVSSIVTRSRSKKTLHAAEQDRPDVAAARAALKAEQPSLKAPRLVFIDETAVTTKMVRHYGRSPRGERLVASVPHGHWKTLTFIAALRFKGMTAPYVIDGAMDGPTFIAYVEQVLTPTLKKGDIVVTSGGLVGMIVDIGTDDTIVIKVKPDNVKLQMARSAVASMQNPSTSST